MTTETKTWENSVPPGPLDQLPFDDDEPLLPGGPTVDDVDAPPGETADTDVLASYPVPEAPPEPVKKTRKPRAKKADKGEPVATEVLTGEVMPPEIEAEERALVRIQPAQADHHIVTGMAALARMTDDEFEQAMTAIESGQRRMREFQERAMTKGEDYGTVKGIDRPFLHLPGAEKLCLLYGLAARQEAEVIIGERVFRRVGETEVNDGEWTSPPIAYHVKTYMHLGNFDGPIVAMGYGEANSWETKYRYVQERPKCPQCGHDLRRGPKEGTAKMVGKWFCPGFAGPGGGGCWWSVAITATNPDGSLVVPTPGKVENPDPHSLRETLIQMAAKRSLVAATRRATGTSGLFTQDEDSPSVERQSDDAGPDEAPPEVEAVANAAPVERGAKVTAPTQVQINRLSQLSREKDLGPVNLAIYFNRVTGIPVNFAQVPDDRAAQSAILLAAIQTATADQIGALINTLETGEVPQEATPGEPPQGS